MILYATDFDRTKRIVIDTYTSLDWEPAYDEVGNFELHLQKNLADKIDFGMIIENSEDLMFQGLVTCKEYDTSEGIDSDVVIKGHFLAHMLEFRIIDDIEKENVAFSTVVNEALFQFQSGTRGFGRSIEVQYSDESIKSEPVEIKAENETLLSVLLEICKQINAGLNFILNDDKSLTLLFYIGEDKSNDVVISLDRDTAVEVNYYKDIETEGNYFYVKGNGYQDGETEIFEFTSGSSYGSSRKEVFVDLTSLPRKRKDGTFMSERQYKAALWAIMITSPDGILGYEEIESKVSLKYQEEYGNLYKIGDIITQEFKELSVELKSKITTVSQSWGENGHEITLICTNVGTIDKVGV